MVSSGTISDLRPARGCERTTSPARGCSELRWSSSSSARDRRVCAKGADPRGDRSMSSTRSGSATTQRASDTCPCDISLRLRHLDPRTARHATPARRSASSHQTRPASDVSDSTCPATVERCRTSPSATSTISSSSLSLSDTSPATAMLLLPDRCESWSSALLHRLVCGIQVVGEIRCEVAGLLLDNY